MLSERDAQKSNALLSQVVDTDEAERKMLDEIRELCMRTSAVKKEVAEAAS